MLAAVSEKQFEGKPGEWRERVQEGSDPVTAGVTSALRPRQSEAGRNAGQDSDSF